MEGDPPGGPEDPASGKPLSFDPEQEKRGGQEEGIREIKSNLLFSVEGSAEVRQVRRHILAVDCDGVWRQLLRICALAVVASRLKSRQESAEDDAG